MFEDWGTLQTVLAVVLGILVVYWVAMFFLVSYAQRDLQRRGVAGWLAYAFLWSTPLGLVLWLVARKFFPVQDEPSRPANRSDPPPMARRQGGPRG